MNPHTTFHWALCALSKTQIPGPAAKSRNPLARAGLALLGALALMGASTQAETIAGTGISTFPYTITASGLYHLTANNSTYNRTNGAAITINLSAAYKDNDVVLDMNEHTIVQTNRNYSIIDYVGSYPTGIKVVSTGTGRVTVRNGTLRGFGIGIDISGDRCLIEDMTVIGTSRTGIRILGNNGLVRNNRIIGTTDQVHGYSGGCRGILCGGNGMRFINNDVQDTNLSDTSDGAYAMDIYAVGDDLILENNRVSKMPDGSYLHSYGMIVEGNGLVVNSHITSCYGGIYLSGGKYRDNLVDGATIPYDVSATDAGNNQ